MIRRGLVRALTRPLDSRGHSLDVQAIIVLGAPARADGSLPPPVRERVEVALQAWQFMSSALLVFSGRGRRGPVEAEAMAAHARKLGAPDSNIRLETESMSTWENATRCAELLLPRCRQVVVVSQPFHLRRACTLFRRAGFEPTGLAASDSLHYRDPSRGLRWAAREYAAWLALGARDARAALKGLKP